MIDQASRSSAVQANPSTPGAASPVASPGKQTLAEHEAEEEGEQAAEAVPGKQATPSDGKPDAGSAGKSEGPRGEAQSTPAEGPRGEAQSTAPDGPRGEAQSTPAEGPRGEAQSTPAEGTRGEAHSTPTLTLGRGGRGGTAAGGGGGAGGPAANVAAAIRVNNWQIAPGNPSRTRTRVGVGEMVELSTQGSGGTWSASRAHPNSATVGGRGPRSTYMWQAPDTPGAAQIQYSPPNNGAIRTIDMEVVAPNSVAFTNPRPYVMARAGAGMVNSVEIGPRDVSFENAQWKEEGGSAAAPRDAQGYFQRHRANGADLNHHPNPAWLNMDAMLNDTAGVGGLPPLDNGQWTDGSFHWDIPNRYTVGSQGEGHVFANVRQSFRIAANGSVTVTKGAQSITSAPGPAASARNDSPEDRARFQATLRGEGLELLLDRLRDAPDEPTKRLIRDVIGERTPRMKITVKCTNSYSWFTDDSLLITVNNRPTSRGRFSIDTGQTKSDTIGFFGVYELSALETGRVPGLDINVRADGNDLGTRIATPFRDTEFERLNSRYQVKYELLNHRGSNQMGGAGGDI